VNETVGESEFIITSSNPIRAARKIMLFSHFCLSPSGSPVSAGGENGAPSPPNSSSGLGELPYDHHSCDISSQQMCQIWLMLARTDGCCGQLLGSAFARGYEGIRSWVCSCVLWGPGNVLPSPPPFFRHSADEGPGYERHIYGVSLGDVDRSVEEEVVKGGRDSLQQG
jgi:hypothetical protein